MQIRTHQVFVGLAALTLAVPVHAAIPPVVSNVVAAQRPDKVVAIHYDLVDADGDACTISVQASSDGGATWSIPVATLSGDVGPGVLPGNEKLVLWDCKVDLPGVVGSQFKVRICADDGHNLAPSVFDPVVTGEPNESEQGALNFACSAIDPDGTVLSLTVNLGALGGSATVPLSKGSGNRWTGSASIAPPAEGAATVTFTAIDNRNASASIQASVEVRPAGMVLIPAGQFQMGDSFSVEGDLNERPLHAVYVDKFLLARHEVSNQHYADGLNWARGQGGLIMVSGGVVYKAGSGTSYPLCDTSTSSQYGQITWDGTHFGVVAGKENYPVVQVNWYGAVAYANWRSAMDGRTPAYDLSTWTCNFGSGFRLPTEAEWERAARGGAIGHRFPWPDSGTIDHSRANYYSSTHPFYDGEVTAGYDPVFGVGEYPYTSPVGHFAKNGYGLYDMSGNVWEWCNDWFDGNYYATSPASNPRGPASGETRILRGGSWGSLAVNQRCAYRSNGLPSYRGITNGFRLVLPPN